MTSLPLRVQRFYESFGDLHEKALDALGEHFTDDIHFKDPYRETWGMLDFRELFVRMFRRYKHVSFVNFRRDGEEPAFTLTYDMRMQMVVGPVFVTPMASICRSRDGKVDDLVDYYDISQALFSPFPRLRAAYRKVVKGTLL